MTTQSFTSKLKSGIDQFLTLSIIFAAFLFLIRIFETIYILSVSSFSFDIFYLQLKGFGFDFLFFLNFSALILIPTILFYLISYKLSRVFYSIISVIIALISVSLISYFATTRIPLGADIFGYSISEMQHTIRAAGKFSILSILPILLVLTLSIFAFYRIKHIYLHDFFKSAIITLMFLSLLLVSESKPTTKHYNNDYEMNIAGNKFVFFMSSTFDYLKNYTKKTDISLNNLAQHSDNNENNFEYINKEYPLLHKENTPDVLGQYFTKSDSAPSFVFIIVESLGRAYCGENAYLGSFTPFLDSLMQKSLYWENNLSTTGRTFGVLPSLLASLPFGKNGFAEMGDKMPSHLSFLNVLKKNANYKSAFYYGGDSHFDNMDLFMRKQNVNLIVDSKSFSSKYQKLPASENGFAWGYGDKEIFRKYLDDKSTTKQTKSIDVILTLAMHNPFLIQNQEAYNQRVESRMQALNLTEKKKEFNRQYIPQFASILYFDDALRYFMQEFSKRKEFEHTIFIITGDHRMPEIPISTQIDRFHVPLVIYSPLITKPQKFSSVVSHFDVTPSLLSFLKNNYAVQLPSVSAWIGHGLDNTIDYRSIRSYPLMRNKSEFMDYIDNDRFLSGSNLYTIYNTFDIEEFTDNDVQKRMNDNFQRFKNINTYVTENNRIIPDSLIIK